MMMDPLVTSGAPRRPDRRQPGPPEPEPEPDRGGSPPDDARDGILAGLEPSPEPAAQADRRNVQGKLAAGWRGLKAAVRGDSSFFAHSYRGTLIAIAATMLGVDLRGWCLLALGACLVLLSELTHSAVDTLARAVGDPEEYRLRTAREIAAAGVLVAAVGAAAVTLTVLGTRLVELLGWRL
jgi:diacylglycerol kinase